MRALILSDLQNDFMPWGSLGIEKSDEIIPIANKLMEQFDLVIAAMDWHPANHQSFAANHPWRLPGQIMEIDGKSQKLWTIHCVHDTLGAELANGLSTVKIIRFVKKGRERSIESYGAFCENDPEMRDNLVTFLKDNKVESIFVLGTLADFGVKYTAIDATRQEFKTNVIIDACRWFDPSNENVEKTLNELKNKGVKIINSTELI